MGCIIRTRLGRRYHHQIEALIALYEKSGHFISADSIVPGAGNPSAYDRYGYVGNNPIVYKDPSGHYSDEQVLAILGVNDWGSAYTLFEWGRPYHNMWGLLDILRKAKDGNKLEAVISTHINLSTGERFEISSKLGEFKLVGRTLNFINAGKMWPAVPLITSGAFDKVKLYYSNTNFKWLYIKASSPNYTRRVLFHPDQVDWFSACLDTGGIALDLFTAGSSRGIIIASKLALETVKTADEIISGVDAVTGLVQYGNDPTFENALGAGMDIAYGIPIIPDLYGLISNFGNAIEFAP